jgi:hypothetical protein
MKQLTIGSQFEFKQPFKKHCPKIYRVIAIDYDRKGVYFFRNENIIDTDDPILDFAGFGLINAQSEN